MTGKTRILTKASLAFLMLIPAMAEAQVFHNSRHRASANPSATRNIHSGAISISQPGRSGNSYQSGANVFVPGMTYSSGHEPTYSNSRYRVFGHGSLNGSVRTYSSYPGQIQYSVHGPTGIGHHHHHDDYLHPHVYISGGAPLGIQYSNWHPYPTIIAPPIVLPYGGIGPSGFMNVSPVPSFPAIPQQIGAPPPASLQPLPTENGEPLSRIAPVDEPPVLNEFPAGRVVEAHVAAVERIRSLRYQTTGDDAFRKTDYATAEVFYRTATETAPGRRAPWIRVAWAQAAQERFDEAIVSLKKGLLITGDTTTAWVEGAELYGTGLTSHAVLQNDALWKWLEERPKSTDRLVLAAAFHQMTGRTSIAEELLEQAIRIGVDQSLADAFQAAIEPPDMGQLPLIPAAPIATEKSVPLEPIGPPIPVD